MSPRPPAVAFKKSKRDMVVIIVVVLVLCFLVVAIGLPIVLGPSIGRIFQSVGSALSGGTP
jgi:hypothetical protein